MWKSNQTTTVKPGCSHASRKYGRRERFFKSGLFERNPAGEWFRVTGWRDDQDDPLCPAFAQLVEDSGSGFAYLVYGGMYGLRFKPATSDEPWSLADSTQWGEAYLLLGGDQDLIYAG